MLDFKHIHIGRQIEEISNEQNITLERACKFLKCDAVDIENMYRSASLDSQLLLQWSKLLNYNLFMFYHTHLQIYSPSSATARIKKIDTKDKVISSEFRFRKNLYSPEIIEWLLAKLETRELSVKEIIKRYNIPKTTIYRWKKKAQQTKFNSPKEEIRNCEINIVNYKLIYSEFIKEVPHLNTKEKSLIISKLPQLSNDKLKYQTLYYINNIIQNNNKSNSIKTLNTYDNSYIKNILTYQKEYNLSNSDISNEYKLSRNTIAKWKKIFSKVD